MGTDVSEGPAALIFRVETQYLPPRWHGIPFQRTVILLWKSQRLTSIIIIIVIWITTVITTTTTPMHYMLYKCRVFKFRGRMCWTILNTCVLIPILSRQSVWNDLMLKWQLIFIQWHSNRQWQAAWWPSIAYRVQLWYNLKEIHLLNKTPHCKWETTDRGTLTNYT